VLIYNIKPPWNTDFIHFGANGDPVSPPIPPPGGLTEEA
jgi:hypothetical protein